MSYDIASLQTRLATLNANLKHTLQLVQRLSRTQPADATATGNLPDPQQDDSEVRADLTASIHEQLRSAEDDLEILRQDVTDADHVQTHVSGRSSRRSVTVGRDNETQRETARCLAGCEKLGEDLKLTRTRFRRAQLAAKSNAERATQRERASYLSSLQAAAAASAMAATQESVSDQDSAHAEDQKPKYTDLFAGRRPRPSNTPTSAVQDDILLTTSADITSSLRRTHNLLQSEVSRSEFARETLEQSNAALKELNQRYDTFDDLLAKSRGLLGTLLRSQKSDNWYLETTCWLLFGVIAWLVFRRFIYGPFWWFFYMPLKLVYNLLWGFGYTLGITGGSKATTTTAISGTTVIGSAIVSPSVASQSVRLQSGASHASGNSAAARSPPGSLSESVGSMMEGGSSSAPLQSQPAEAGQDSSNNQNSRTEDKDEQQEAVQRGDNEVLPERDEKTQPRNPKKRMMEEPVDEGQDPNDDKTDTRKDEL